ncbi:M23 family metallopeptidase [Streptomyces sp. TRM 70361]|uniref:M23 family metallopeptidase n=1 Tax=Streptomyces sp. TRM 70361 TaxID=3116553 RepID=UPI002E7B7866|nr:M23 family metallopeptidase [Streptomyces sp. TRM 70361]MEE1940921.1 M23 family metallopeptidase [Streptomyces sp. TRM 70361]
MAFNRATGQFTDRLTERITGLTGRLTGGAPLSARAVRTGAGLAGAAALAATGVVGTLATPAAAASDGTPRTYALGYVQAVAVGDTIADDVRAQAEAQRRAADASRERAGAAGSAEDASATRAAAKERAAKERAADRSADRTAQRRAASGYTAPYEGARTTTPYKASGTAWSSGSHSGIDFPVPTGTAIRSVGPGTVVTAGWGGAYGNQVVIRHKDGRYTQYAHLSSLGVAPGQSVGAGDRIGLSGSTGNSTGPHLHFEARTGADYGSDIDPIAYLRSKGIGV